MSSSPFPSTFEKPYYAVIFSSVRTGVGSDEYAAAAQRMVELASGQKGFLGIESVRGSDGAGITISYWESLDDVRRWKLHAEHLEAQRRGREEWYREFRLRIALVERDAAFP